MPIRPRPQPAVDEIDRLPPDDDGARLRMILQIGRHGRQMRAMRRLVGQAGDDALAGGDARGVLAERHPLFLRQRPRQERNAGSLGAEDEQAAHAPAPSAWAMG